MPSQCGDSGVVGDDLLWNVGKLGEMRWRGDEERVYSPRGEGERDRGRDCGDVEWRGGEGGWADIIDRGEGVDHDIAGHRSGVKDT